MIYILHFDTPYYHARHYIGYCADGTLEQRLARHRAGLGSRLMLAIELAGIGFTVALTHPGDRRFERKIKLAKNTPRFCPLCRGTSSTTAASRRLTTHPALPRSANCDRPG
jgi:predicted GIY-YIG superfamily endonuclease